MDERKPAKKPYKPVGFFKKGNKYGKGRPKLSLKRPDVLLPAIFAHAGINWAADFTRLYKAMRRGDIQPEEKLHFMLLMKLLPFMITKIDLKPDELKKHLDQNSSISAAKATTALLKALEQESNVKPSTESPSQKDGMGIGEPPVPPSAEPA